jgi:prolipoprotein diacylglyceryltransferase
MYPRLGDFPSYYAAWLLAAVCGIAIGVRIAKHNAFPLRSSAIGLASSVITILVGSKALYLLEARFFPHDDYVPGEMRGLLHGFRIPGGILLMGLTTVPVCRMLHLDWRRFGDVLIPMAAFAVGIIRLGCFLNGCCFGSVSTLPWAIRFPRESWVHFFHQHKGWIVSAAPLSLPVHPLQLYFLIAAVMTFGVVLALQSRVVAPGLVQIAFYVLFFSTTALLEPCRQNYLTLNNWLAPAATLGCAYLLLAVGMPRPFRGGRADTKPVGHATAGGDTETPRNDGEIIGFKH